MSLLTQEQIAKLEQVNSYCLAYSAQTYPERADITNITHSLYCFIGDLRAIIDDLQSRAPKQYTEQEHYAEFEKVYPPLEGVAHKQIFKGWLMCARFLGALKAEP